MRQSDLIGPNDKAISRSQEIRARKQYAIDQIFRSDGITEVIASTDSRAQTLYKRYAVQRTSDGHYFTTLKPVPAELELYVIR